MTKADWIAVILMTLHAVVVALLVLWFKRTDTAVVNGFIDSSESQPPVQQTGDANG